MVRCEDLYLPTVFKSHALGYKQSLWTKDLPHFQDVFFHTSGCFLEPNS